MREKEVFMSTVGPEERREILPTQRLCNQLIFQYLILAPSTDYAQAEWRMFIKKGTKWCYRPCTNTICEGIENQCREGASWWPNLITSRSYTPWCHPLLVSIMEWPFLCLHAGKGKRCIWHANKVEIYISKKVFMDAKWPNLITPGSYTPWSHPLLVSIMEWPLICLHAGKGKCCM